MSLVEVSRSKGVSEQHRRSGQIACAPSFDFRRSLAFLDGFGPMRGEQGIAAGELTQAVVCGGQVLTVRVREDGAAERAQLAYSLASDRPIGAGTEAAVARRTAFFLSALEDLEPFYQRASEDKKFAVIAARLHGLRHKQDAVRWRSREADRARGGRPPGWCRWCARGCRRRPRGHRVGVVDRSSSGRSDARDVAGGAHEVGRRGLRADRSRRLGTAGGSELQGASRQDRTREGGGPPARTGSAERVAPRGVTRPAPSSKALTTDQRASGRLTRGARRFSLVRARRLPESHRGGPPGRVPVGRGRSSSRATNFFWQRAARTAATTRRSILLGKSRLYLGRRARASVTFSCAPPRRSRTLGQPLQVLVAVDRRRNCRRRCGGFAAAGAAGASAAAAASASALKLLRRTTRSKPRAPCARGCYSGESVAVLSDRPTDSARTLSSSRSFLCWACGKVVRELLLRLDVTRSPQTRGRSGARADGSSCCTIGLRSR